MAQRNIYHQLALFLQNPLIPERTLEKISNHLEKKLEKYPVTIETVAMAIKTLKSRIKEYKANDPAKNGYLRKLCLVLAQVYSSSASKQDIEDSNNFLVDIFSPPKT